MLQQQTINFLKELEQNNYREWFQDHKPWYQESLADFKNFASKVGQELMKSDEIDRMTVYRIYRDLRFSTDKTPYKNHFSAHFARKGKYRRGGLYLEVFSKEVLVAGGFWNPHKDDLRFIREGIAVDPEALRNTLAHPEVESRFGHLEGDELKTAPKGYDRDHPQIDLLRKKQFLLTRIYSHQTAGKKDFYKSVASDFTAMIPVFQIFTEYLVYDLNGEER